MKSKGQANIPISLITQILPLIIITFTTALNSIFLGDYPKDWNPIMKCLPKKGKLNIPSFRGIGIKNVFAKIYDSILRSRLEKFIKTPEEQTAYQKKKGCCMHVFFVRAILAIARKKNIPFFIGVTDFACAFDGISRRILFQKLIKFGIGMFMLNALSQMYTNTWTFIEMNGEYSKEFLTTSGVIQGSATSTILFMAYTSDVIQLFQSTFDAEYLIHLYHILLHADDALILATSKDILIKKFKFMEKYCIDNCITLEPSKCKFLCINSNQHEDIILQSGQIESKTEAIYLGSTITNQGNINNDIKNEINKKQKAFNKYYGFLRTHYNAPIAIKLRVLQACVYSTVTFNCETWGNATLTKLEKQYCNILKSMLGVNKIVCNEIVYVELGLPTLESVIRKGQWTFYKNILVKNDWPMLRYIVNQSRTHHSNFITHYDNLIKTYVSAEEITEKSMADIRDSINQKALQGRSKFCKYLEINPGLDKPNIYESDIPTYKLHQLTKLRVGNHQLQIEIGRHYPTKPREERLCICSEIEDENHFLKFCYLYKEVREQYKLNTNSNISSILDDKSSADYINALFEIRKLFVK